MKIRGILIVLGIMGFVLVSPCSAQEGIANDLTKGAAEAIKANREDALALARDLVKFKRMVVVADNLELNAQEQSAFWQEYGKYQDKLDPLRDRAAKLIISYAAKFDTLTDEDAKVMLEEMLSIQEDESKVRRECLGKFGAILPMKKLARFYQIENKMNAEIRYAMSLEIPLLETEEALSK
jgi:DNA-directed RNA polymerase subunit F